MPHQTPLTSNQRELRVASMKDNPRLTLMPMEETTTSLKKVQ